MSSLISKSSNIKSSLPSYTTPVVLPIGRKSYALGQEPGNCKDGGVPQSGTAKCYGGTTPTSCGGGILPVVS